MIYLSDNKDIEIIPDIEKVYCDTKNKICRLYRKETMEYYGKYKIDNTEYISTGIGNFKFNNKVLVDAGSNLSENILFIFFQKGVNCLIHNGIHDINYKNIICYHQDDISFQKEYNIYNKNE